VGRARDQDDPGGEGGGARSVVLGGGVAATGCCGSAGAAARAQGCRSCSTAGFGARTTGPMIGQLPLGDSSGGRGPGSTWTRSRRCRGSTVSDSARAGTKRPRLDPLAVRRQLRERGSEARHSLSQNFLPIPMSCSRSSIWRHPNRGGASWRLGRTRDPDRRPAGRRGGQSRRSSSIERLADRLSRVNEEAIASGALTLVQGDILDQKISELIQPPFESWPRSISHHESILHRFLDRARPSRLILMLQREVAERISAVPAR